ncbi:LysR substrate-binding domain-containing protein [Azoarcus olearius]|uniref:Probable transcriptional regulator, LysR family n=1 Tax=Azoarcus sp. (strain BH72) TaxID=418699 RepID=A1KBN2_AZOSB|nr:LysR substrate-binding domain-containing protein [Azoarcus olearius]ANQ86782.1 LysR family transcriptional regulator [Azoarcus olearius]CAL96238.1 probable transcriptional regulator, LysR family [Azoarcus olearius]
MSNIDSPANRWDGLEAFVAVADCGSFGGAAERLGVSTSHVSRQVARLEERLQARLFYRSTRRVSLTETGQVFLQHCRRLQDGFDEALHAVQDLGGAPKGLLRMTCAVTYGERFIVPLVNDFIERYPELRVEIELTNAMLDIVREGYDLAIRLGRLTDSSLVATRIAPRVMYLCAAPSYLARRGTPQTLAELAGHDCLLGSADTWVFQDQGREHFLRVQGNWRCNSGEAVLDAALRGFGLAQLPDYYVLEHLREGRLRALLTAYQPPHTAVWALFPQQRYLSPKVRMMVEHLRVALARRPEYA